jgi:hypothetical protein
MGAQNDDGKDNIQQEREDHNDRIDKTLTATTTMMIGTAGHSIGIVGT